FCVATDLPSQTHPGCHSMSCLKSRMVNSHGKLEMAVVNITVVMGTKTFSDINLERKQVQKIIAHKDYKPPHLDSDLCLLLLATPVQFNKVKMPICLPQKESSWDRCWMAEWTSTHGHDKFIGMHNISTTVKSQELPPTTVQGNHSTEKEEEEVDREEKKKRKKKKGQGTGREEEERKWK
ncbi:hypothetical protein STEG23_030342, partial [Scotinomys teguina]